jgi:hypothetical protein
MNSMMSRISYDGVKKSVDIFFCNGTPVLLPMELRFLNRRGLPQKYCADLQNHFLYSPKHYFKIPIENRLFFYPEDVILAIQHGFNFVPHHAKWLHRVWKALQKDSQKEIEKYHKNMRK